MREILEKSKDPVVRYLATHNEGYLIEETLRFAEAYNKFWSSWRGYLLIYVPTFAVMISMFVIVYLIGLSR
jgi:hypothetical protein